MREEIPLKLRFLAVALHLLGGSITTYVVIGSALLGFALLPVVGDFILDSGFFLIPLSIFISPPLILILWAQTRDIHPFLDQSGRDAINCLLSTVVGLLISIVFTIFVFSVTCGVGNQNPTPFFLSFIPFFLVAIAYFVNSIVAAIFAIQGYRLNSRLVYPFIKPL
jgi:uncharacterized Tic20 family protein